MPMSRRSRGVGLERWNGLMAALLHRDLGLRRHRLPDGDVFANEGGELGRRVSDRLHRLGGEGGLRVRLLQYPYDLAVELVDDRRGRARRRQDAVPCDRIEAGIA